MERPGSKWFIEHPMEKKLGANVNGYLETEMQEVAKMKRHSPYGFSKNLEYGEDFNAITRAAYFDYRQDKIYWRGKDNKRKRKDEPQHHGRGQPTWQPKKATR